MIFYFFVVLYSRCLNRTMKVDLHTETTLRMLLNYLSLFLSLAHPFAPPWSLDSSCSSRRTCRCVLFLRSCRGDNNLERGRGKGRVYIDMAIYLLVSLAGAYRERERESNESMRFLCVTIRTWLELLIAYRNCQLSIHIHIHSRIHSRIQIHKMLLQLHYYIYLSIGERAYRDSCWAIWIYSSHTHTQTRTHTHTWVFWIRIEQ